MKALFMIIFLMCSFVFAQVSGDVSGGEKALEVITQVDSKIPLELSAGILAGIIFFIELLMRFIPTAQPRSLLILVGSIFKVLGNIFTKLSGLADKIVQNLKEKK